MTNDRVSKQRESVDCQSKLIARIFLGTQSYSVPMMVSSHTRLKVKIQLMRDKDARLVPLSNRKYNQIDTIASLNLILSRSGKYDVVSIHDISSFKKVRKRAKFETETRLKKLKETRGCTFYTVSKPIFFNESASERLLLFMRGNGKVYPRNEICASPIQQIHEVEG